MYVSSMFHAEMGKKSSRVPQLPWCFLGVTSEKLFIYCQVKVCAVINLYSNVWGY